jgi:hypothetical protein
MEQKKFSLLEQRELFTNGCGPLGVANDINGIWKFFFCFSKIKILQGTLLEIHCYAGKFIITFKQNK